MDYFSKAHVAQMPVPESKIHLSKGVKHLEPVVATKKGTGDASLHKQQRDEYGGFSLDGLHRLIIQP